MPPVAPADNYTAPCWLRALALLPPPLFRAAGWPMGLALWLLAPGRRRVLLRNLDLCFPQSSVWQRRRWAWQTLLHFSQSFLDRVWLWQGAPERIQSRVVIHDPHAVLQRSGPIIFFAPHFYGLDAGWARLTLSIAKPWVALYAPQSNQALDRWIMAGRQRFGDVRLLSRRKGLQPLIRGIREGASAAFLPDMDLGAKHSVFVPFFGVTAATVPSLARLAQATQAPVASLWCRMVPGGYVVEVGNLWADYPTGDEVADARRMNAELEQIILTMPGQYHWLHRRFKTRPPGAPALYQD